MTYFSEIDHNSNNRELESFGVDGNN